MASHLYNSRLGKVAWFVRRFGAGELLMKPLRLKPRKKQSDYWQIKVVILIIPKPPLSWQKPQQDYASFNNCVENTN